MLLEKFYSIVGRDDSLAYPVVYDRFHTLTAVDRLPGPQGGGRCNGS